jgi:hypothetical protein
MDTFAETANVDYRLSFADQGKNLCFRFPHIHVYIHIHIHVDKHIHLCMYASISNGKQKTEAQAIFLNPFTICSSAKGSYPFANGLNGPNRLAYLWFQFCLKKCLNKLMLL